MNNKLALKEIISPAIALSKDYAARREMLDINEKSAGQFVSEADEAIETAIRNAIKLHHGNVAIIGEEQGGSLGSEVSGWAIDPIDGTTNFLRGLPIWGISVGLLENGVSVAGAIALPDLGLLIISEPDAPLELNGNSFERPRTPLGGKLIALGENDWETGQQTDARAKKLRSEGYFVVRYRSAVFSLACAALGKIDGYVEHGCGLWDVAAGSVICARAGLKVETKALDRNCHAIEVEPFDDFDLRERHQSRI